MPLKGDYEIQAGPFRALASWSDVKSDGWIQLGHEVSEEESRSMFRVKNRVSKYNPLATHHADDDPDTLVDSLFDRQHSFTAGTVVSLRYRDENGQGARVVVKPQKVSLEYLFPATTGPIEPAIYYDTRIENSTVRMDINTLGRGDADDSDDDDGIECKAMCMVQATAVTGEEHPVLFAVRARIVVEQLVGDGDDEIPTGETIVRFIPERLSFHIPSELFGTLFDDRQEHDDAVEWARMKRLADTVLDEAIHSNSSVELSSLGDDHPERIKFLMSELIGPPMGGIGRMGRGLGRGLTRGGRSLGRGIGRGLRRGRSIRKGVGKRLGNLKGRVRGARKSVLGAGKRLGKRATTSVAKKFQSAKGSVSKRIQSVKGRAATFKNNVKSRVNSLKGKARGKLADVKKRVGSRVGAIRGSVAKRFTKKPIAARPTPTAAKGPLPGAKAQPKAMPKPPVSNQPPRKPLPPTPAKKPLPRRHGEGSSHANSSTAHGGSNARPASTSSASQKPYWEQGHSAPPSATKPTTTTASSKPPAQHQPHSSTSSAHKPPSQPQKKSTPKPPKKDKTKTTKKEKRPKSRKDKDHGGDDTDDRRKKDRDNKSHSSGSDKKHHGGDSGKHSDNNNTKSEPPADSGAPSSSAAAASGNIPPSFGQSQQQQQPDLQQQSMVPMSGIPMGPNSNIPGTIPATLDQQQLALLGQQRLADATAKYLGQQSGVQPQQTATTATPSAAPASTTTPVQPSGNSNSTIVNIDLGAALAKQNSPVPAATPAPTSDSSQATAATPIQDSLDESPYDSEEEDDDGTSDSYTVIRFNDEWPDSVVCGDELEREEEDEVAFDPIHVSHLAKRICDHYGHKMMLESERKDLEQRLDKHCFSHMDALAYTIDVLIDKYRVHENM